MPLIGRNELGGEPAADGAPRSYGFFAPLVFHADGGRARLGLGRHQPGQQLRDHRTNQPERATATAGDCWPVAPSNAAAAIGDPLTISSDGARPFGWHSAPFGDLGEPVRRFDLVRDGVVADLALDLCEAALRGQSPNGGVRDLVVSPGAAPATELMVAGARPLVIASQVRWLEWDPRSGTLALELGAGHLLRGTTRTAVAGGALTGDAIALLHSARRSRELASHAWHHGPILYRFDDVRELSGTGSASSTVRSGCDFGVPCSFAGRRQCDRGRLLRGAPRISSLRVHGTGPSRLMSDCHGPPRHRDGARRIGSGLRGRRTPSA